MALIVSALAVVAVLVGAVPSVVGGQDGDAGGDTEVRIVARRVTDGRVEFGLQERGAGGWGERLLPRQRFFPVGAAVGRWLVSTPLVVGGDAGGDTEVRIVARRVADGRVEFGLQERGAGGWGERLLPRQRFFPAGAAVGRWLVSTPLVVGRGDVSTTVPGDVDSTPSGAAPTTTTTGPVSSGGLAERVGLLVLDGVNELRIGLAPLALDGGVTAAAQAVAQAMVDVADWRFDFDLGSHLTVDWDTWRRASNRWTSRDPADPATAGSFAEGLLDVSDYGRAALRCGLCTHLGVGVATGGGRTYGAVVVAGRAPAVSAIAAAEAEMLALVNQLRAGLGLGRLDAYPAVGAVARGWSQTMGAEERLYHNPDYWEQYPPGALSGAENVSQIAGPVVLREAVRASFDSLVGSPGHYRNMTNGDYTHLGVGIAVDNGSLWVTQNFAAYPPGTDTGTGGTDTGTGSDPSTDPGDGGDTAPARRVTLTKGSNAQDVHSGCTSSNCHYLRVELVDFPPGSYTVYCVHYGVPSAGWSPGYWRKYDTSATTSEDCIWGVADHDVYVIVEDPATGARFRSNDARWP